MADQPPGGGLPTPLQRAPAHPPRGQCGGPDRGGPGAQPQARPASRPRPHGPAPAAGARSIRGSPPRALARARGGAALSQLVRPSTSRRRRARPGPPCAYHRLAPIHPATRPGLAPPAHAASAGRPLGQWFLGVRPSGTRGARLVSHAAAERGSDPGRRHRQTPGRDPGRRAPPVGRAQGQDPRRAAPASRSRSQDPGASGTSAQPRHQT